MSFGRRLQYLLSFGEFPYFNAKVRYKKLALGGRNSVEKTVLSS